MGFGLASPGRLYRVRRRERIWRGRLAQLVEHLVYTERVGGSRPSPPTTRKRGIAFGRSFRLLLLAGVLTALTLPLALRDARAEQPPMNFRIAKMDSPGCGAKCPEVVVADGVIEPETPLAFLDFAKTATLSHALRGVVFLNSPGGNVVASMELGAVFRRLRLAAIVAGFAASGDLSGPVAGECVSACVYALMGATRRVAPPSSRIALHRMSVTLADASGSGIAARRFADARLVALVARYASRMGVSPALVWSAESLPPDHIHLLTPQEIAHWRLASTRF